MFSGPNEKAFIEHFSKKSRAGVILSGIIGIVIYDLFAIFDYLTTPHAYQQIWLIRLGVTGAAIIALSLMGTSLGRKHLRLMTLSIALSVSLSVLWIFAISNPKQLPREITGISITIIFCMAGLRLLMREAIIYSALIAGTFFALASSRDVAQDVLAAYFISIPAVIAVGLAVVYITEFYARKSFADEEMIQHERAKSDKLLFNTFPAEIAYQLKDNPGVIAKREDHATVMFCDLMGFTAACAEMAPEDVVRGLNQIFSELDRLTAEFKCEKIKTIGDSYMAVSGVPTPTEEHAVRIVNLALAFKAAASSMTLNGKPINFRIGICSGPVVAGVIGESRFAYDIWGDTVNTASRMESLAPSGCIQITESTRLALQDRFVLEKLPAFQVKGKGMMESWLVISALQSPAATKTASSEMAA